MPSLKEMIKKSAIKIYIMGKQLVINLLVIATKTSLLINKFLQIETINKDLAIQVLLTA